jgi:hypothetical protein
LFGSLAPGLQCSEACHRPGQRCIDPSHSPLCSKCVICARAVTCWELCAFAPRAARRSRARGCCGRPRARCGRRALGGDLPAWRARGAARSARPRVRARWWRRAAPAKPRFSRAARAHPPPLVPPRVQVHLRALRGGRGRVRAGGRGGQEERREAAAVRARRPSPPAGSHR